MAQGTVRVKGLQETIRAFNRLDRGVAREIRHELKVVAEPVAASARGKIGRYRGASTSTIRPVTSTRGVVVRQSKKKVTGQHGQFGTLQMFALLTALSENEGNIREGLEGALDRITRKEGF